jgi:hypothetical protein
VIGACTRTSGARAGERRAGIEEQRARPSPFFDMRKGGQWLEVPRARDDICWHSSSEYSPGAGSGTVSKIRQWSWSKSGASRRTARRGLSPSPRHSNSHARVFISFGVSYTPSSAHSGCSRGLEPSTLVWLVKRVSSGPQPEIELIQAKVG